MKPLKLAVFVVAVLGVVALLVSQQLEIKRLAAESAELRARLSQMTALQGTNEQLAEQLKTAVAIGHASQNELMRVRGQSSRLRQLEQENARLKAQAEQADRQLREAQPAATASPQPPQPAPAAINPAPNTTDLGALELTDGIAARFDLGGGTNCVVTPTALSDGNVLMQIRAEILNADGTASELATSRLTARPGQHCSISVGDRMIALAVTLK